MSAGFLLEVGCEEIPAWTLPRAQASLQALLERELGARGLLGEEPIQCLSTPRRLAAACARLADREATRVEQVNGPPKKIAFDADGKPTRAAERFANKMGLEVKNLRVVETPKGAYLAAVREIKGRATRAVLGELLPSLILRIDFPRSMYWTTAAGVHFIRPIRWLLALYGGQVVEFTLEGVRSARTTRGHRQLSNNLIQVRRPADYPRRLRLARVLVHPAERRDKIARESQRLLASQKLRPRKDPELLEMLVNMVEYPTVIEGEFNRKFLDLPEEILATVMRHHQKYFAVEDRRGRLAPRFLAVIDLDRDRGGEIRRNHEIVLAARFRDAVFFWQADQQRTLGERVQQLDEVVFQSHLGSYGKKVERLKRLATWLGENARVEGRHADIAALTRAAELCKSDLTTEMVGELPELQGVIGGLYAAAQGEPPAVARAMREHYQPAAADDSPPTTLEGSLLALADKLDTVAGCFSVGLAPTGSKDPFGLRRAANGIVRIALECGLRFSLERAVRDALDEVGRGGIKVPDGAADAVLRFLEERARHHLRDRGGFAYDEVNAAFAAGHDDLLDARARLEAIGRLRPTRDFEPVAVAFKRIRNILQQAGRTGRDGRPVDTALLEPGAERELYEKFRSVAPRVAALKEQQRYEEALRMIAGLRPQVDRFFDIVLVMVKDERVRENRLTMLAHLLKEFSTVADFSEIVVTPKSKE